MNRFCCDKVYQKELFAKKKMEVSNLKQQSKLKAAKYCAYQERTQQEVRNKLYEYGLHTEAVEEVLTELIMDGFISEERYAQAFCRGKFNQNKWGRVKIERALKQKGLSAYCIRQGMKEIDEADYRAQLGQLLDRKWEALADEDDYARKHKTARYLLGKGYEADLIWQLLN
jgi:regulatory protein